MKEYLLEQEKDIDRLAAEFVERIGESRVFGFYGEMGAGKTTFIKAVCRQLDVKDNVSSPTFALVYEYFSDIAGPVYHFDLYRIKDLSEMYDLGYEEYFYSGNLCFIEWPELMEELLPGDTRKVIITKKPDNARIVQF